MKKFLFLLLLSSCSFVGFSQNQLQIQSSSKGFYITHTVSPKENLYAVGRLYNISPKEIAAFNNMDMNAGLAVGQTVMIPLEASNFSQTTSKGTPVYYTVGDKEGLYRVSLKNKKVLMANLRKWNNLSSDNISAGTKLIVGYLVSPETQNEAVNTVAKTNTTTNNSVNNNTAPVAAPPKQEKPVEEKKPVDEKKQVEEKPVVKTIPVSNPVTPPPAASGDAGYFKSLYDQQIKTAPASKDQTVTSGIFKTASGWQDGKYYALMDKVDPGTIVRVINPTNNKSIYAKVLGEMSGIRQNQGLELRLSNAGANALEVSDTEKFIVRVIY